MSRLLLIRHGQASFGADDYDCLSALGERQARVLGQYLKLINVQPSQIISGEMKRHRQTRDIVMAELANVCETPPQSVENPDWNEFDHQKVLAGLDPKLAEPSSIRNLLKTHPDPHAEFMRLFGEAMSKWISAGDSPDYPESFAAFMQRARDGISKTPEKPPKDHVSIVFTSGGVITAILLGLLDIPHQRMLSINKDLVNCGVTTLRLGRGGPSLLTLNEHAAFIHAGDDSLITYR